MATWNDTLSYVAEFMAASIAKFGLILDGNPGEMAIVKSPGCTIRLANIDNVYVRFEFWNPANPEEVFTLHNYLNCAYNHRGLELSPNMPRDLPEEEQFTGCLRNYDRLLCEGYFDAPLSGDHSWVPRYHAMLQEITELSIARLDLQMAGHPEAISILDKELDGDPSWMDDVRRILAEQSGDV